MSVLGADSPMAARDHAGTFLEVVDFLSADLKGERAAAFQRYAERGLPTHKDEEWKYTSLRLLAETGFEARPLANPDASLLEGIPGLSEGLRLVFWNGAYSADLSKASLPEGVTFKTLADELPAEFGRIASFEGKLGSTNDNRFVDLNSALFRDGVWLDIAPGTMVEEPIQVVFLSTEGALNFPRLFVRTGKNAQAKIVEFHAGRGAYATVPVAEVELDSDAMLEHTRLQYDSAEAFHIGAIFANQAGNSTYTSNCVQFGGRIGRIDANVWVGGEHAETWLNGAYVGIGEQHLDNHTRIDHAVPNCHSFEVYKGILSDRSNGVFNGKIFVYKDAQKTDAKQTNQALLLSPTATVDTKPQLEIFADDVKCTHGATVGQLREDAMFYLRSRGLPYGEARNLLVYAFVAEVLEKISVDHVREAFEARLFDKLREAGRL